MKATAIKATLVASALTAAMGMLADDATLGNGTRVDYLDSKGNILKSAYPEGNMVSFQIRGVETPRVTGAFDGYVTKIKYTQWGEESYPVTIETEEIGNPGEKIEVSYKVIDAAGNASARRAPGTQGDVKCGNTIRFTVDMPEGTYPELSVTDLMTGLMSDGEYYSSPYSSIGTDWLQHFRSVYNLVYDRSYIEYLAQKMNGTGDFTRDASNPDRWYIDIVMQNEPMAFSFGIGRKDAARLRRMVHGALDELYCQNQYMWNYHAGGEPQFMMPWGDYMSQDFVSGLYMKIQSPSAFYNMTNLSVDNSFSTRVWQMAMTYVLHANMVLSQIDGFTDASKGERDWARAQMLALRSMGYLRLMQTYGVRWQDSQNGEAYCAPLELTFPALDTPLSKMKQIRDRCYADLDEAINLLQGNSVQRMESLEVDALTAKGIKMRFAMLCEDWAKARDLSKEILDAKPLTTNEEIKSGFFAPADSWIWSGSNYRYNYSDYQDFFNTTPVYQNMLYYCSTQSYDAVNGSYPAAPGWCYGANAIDKALYLSIPASDVRGDLYVMPDRLEGMLRGARWRDYHSWDGWYTSSYFDSQGMFANNFRAYGDNATYERTSEQFSKDFASRKPAGVEYPAFQGIGGNGYSPVMFGAQTKFYQPGVDNFAEAYVVFMRAEEVLLSHAEACFRLGDETSAIEDVNRLNLMRGADVAFTGSGDALFKEIVRTRKIELWGEGHSWYDQKRWNMPMVRSKWVHGDTDSGNWGILVEENIPVDFANGWRWVIPAAEVNFNPAIDRGLMNYKDFSHLESSPEKCPASEVEKTGRGIAVPTIVKEPAQLSR